MGKLSQQQGSSDNDNNTGIPHQTQTFSTSSTIKYQNNDDLQKPSANKFCIKFLINLLIYVICILSLSISLYLSYRHLQLESNVKSLSYLESRVLRIENDLDELIQKTNRQYLTTAINQNIVDDDESTVRRDSINIGDDNVELDASSSNDDSVFKNKLPVHVFSEITRLKRDVSNLKMARRQRQTIQQSPNENCLCPPGESYSSYLFQVKCNFPFCRLRYDMDGSLK